MGTSFLQSVFRGQPGKKSGTSKYVYFPHVCICYFKRHETVVINAAEDRRIQHINVYFLILNTTQRTQSDDLHTRRLGGTSISGRPTANQRLWFTSSLSQREGSRSSQHTFHWGGAINKALQLVKVMLSFLKGQFTQNKPNSAICSNPVCISLISRTQTEPSSSRHPFTAIVFIFSNYGSKWMAKSD